MRILVTCIFAMWISFSWAGYDEAVKAFESEDYAAAFQLLKELPKQDDPDTQYLLGLLYFYGEGVAKNEHEAGLCFYRAAINGHVGAMRMTGKMLIAGRGGDEDYENGYKFLQDAAQHGDSESAAIIAKLDERARLQKKFKPVGKMDEPTNDQLRFMFYKKMRQDSFGVPGPFLTAATKTKKGCKRLANAAFLCNVRLETRMIGESGRKITTLQARVEFDTGEWFVTLLD